MAALQKEGFRMKQLSKFALLVALTVLAAPSVYAQSSGILKIGVVNIGRLLQESPQAQSAKETLQDEFAPRQRELIAMSTELEAKKASLQNDMEVMGVEERENAQRELRNDERAIVRAQTEFREDLDLRQNEALGRVQQEVFGEISAYAESENFDLVLIDGVLHASEKVDVTEQILQRLLANHQGAGPAE